MEDQSYRLIVEYFERTISDEGLVKLQEWLDEDIENLSQFSETIRILEAAKSYHNRPVDADKVWANVQSKINNNKKHHLRIIGSRKWLTYAAACLLVAFTGWFGYSLLFNRPAELQIVSNANGKKSKITLPDGSVVYLAGGSSMKFSKAFTERERAVYLDGEAFFDVVHNKQRPFVVKSGEITTVVLGTSFNVNAYSKLNKVMVTVRTGKVGVMAAVNGKQQLVKYLLPNEQISINTQSDIYAFNKADAAGISAWINNELSYYNTSLKDIASSVEHHYGVVIEFTEPELGDVKLTTSFTNESIDDIAETLSAISGLACTQKGDHIFISNPNQKGGKIMR
ncbi:DUF4974 domain-containing protein [Mucilaginibacter limnophilus]|uniref:DUF4974 domain-containing protein n=1 Tax=Mucilaginibacter limnophilus TaxID=1932778 RepID=A0A437MZ17_9SPHI|nr:FecR domain-containing protein [Mucilaginibacter limnophilus]RVU02869.1 DUF4974 domain-containing protein [Mucilaginibacter limnophilus]